MFTASRNEWGDIIFFIPEIVLVNGISESGEQTDRQQQGLRESISPGTAALLPVLGAERGRLGQTAGTPIAAFDFLDFSASHFL